MSSVYCQAPIKGNFFLKKKEKERRLRLRLYSTTSTTTTTTTTLCDTKNTIQPTKPPQKANEWVTLVTQAVTQAQAQTHGMNLSL
jgi:hypothetical protein